MKLNVGLFDVGDNDVTASVKVVGSTLTLPSAGAGDGIITVIGSNVASNAASISVVGELVGVRVAAVELSSVSAAIPETRTVTYSPFSSSTAMDMPVGTTLPFW